MALYGSLNLQGGYGGGVPMPQSNSLQGNAPAPAAPSAPVGVQTKNPTNNVSRPSNSIPLAQQAPRDLSGTYANVGGTIYNTNSQTKFANAQDFYKDSGLSSFNNVKFNTSYTPTGKETVYGQNTAPSINTATTSITPVATSTTNTSAPVANTPPANNGPYTPPNGGTTGVNQGGIIGNLVNYGNNGSPEYNEAKGFANDILTKQAGLNQDYANATKDIYAGGAGDLSLAGGRAGLLNQLYASKNAALASEYQGATNLISGANTQQQLRQSATQNAGQLNAPITNPQTNGLVSPSSNSTTGSTASGAPLSAQVGSRSNMDVYGIGTQLGADGKTTAYVNKATGQVFSTPQELAAYINSKNPSAGATPANVFDMLKNQEYFNKQTNQGFSSPQALADFVNSQNGNNNATATNVFSMLNGNSNAAGPVSPSDPFYQTLMTAANLIKNNQLDQANALMSSMTPAVKAQVYNMVGGGFDFNAASGAASAQQHNTSVAGTASTDANAAILQKATNTLSTIQGLNGDINRFGSQIISNMPSGVNSSDISVVNSTLGNFLKNFGGDARYATLYTNIQGLQGRVSALLGTGEIPSAATGAAQSIVNGSLPVASLAATIAQIEREGAAMESSQQDVINRAKSGLGSGSGGFTSGNNNSGSTTTIPKGALAF